MTGAGHRLGIDLGGSKIEGLMIDGGGRELARLRVPSPRGAYHATLEALTHVVRQLEAETGVTGAPLGLGIPGSLSPQTGRVRNANSTWLNGQRLGEDLARYLADAGMGRRLRIANDANCFALSEASDGAGRDARSVFGVIIGTGVGGGIVIDGRLVDGPLGIGGEWGHNPLPWMTVHEVETAPACWCGRRGCMETWVSGPGLAQDHARVAGPDIAADAIADRAGQGDAAAVATLSRHSDRLARGLAHIINVLDPEVIVLGGGLSKMKHLYAELPELIAPHIFADVAEVKILPPKWGDASGVRGAAWLAGT